MSYGQGRFNLNYSNLFFSGNVFMRLCLWIKLNSLNMHVNTHRRWNIVSKQNKRAWFRDASASFPRHSSISKGKKSPLLFCFHGDSFVRSPLFFRPLQTNPSGVYPPIHTAPLPQWKQTGEGMLGHVVSMTWRTGEAKLMHLGNRNPIAKIQHLTFPTPSVSSVPLSATQPFPNNW